MVLTEPRDVYLSRVAAMNAGLPKETPAFNVNRLCGSGLQAIISGLAEHPARRLPTIAVAVPAAESMMSRGPYSAAAAPAGVLAWATATMVDMMLGALHDPFHTVHMGITAENVAEQMGHQPRACMDEAGHSRATAAPQKAIEAGYVSRSRSSR